MDNIGAKGSLNTDNVAVVLLQYRNTPLRGIGKLPAELALGRELPHWAFVLQELERSMSAKNEVIKSSSNNWIRCRMIKPGKIFSKKLCF